MKERVTAKVDLDRIRRNYAHIKQLVGSNCRVMAVVKADAYGHGSPRIGRELYASGCRDFAVASLGEAQRLKDAGVNGNILILSPTDIGFADEVISNGFIQAVDSFDYAQALAGKGRIKVHVKVDTGMSRIGIYCHSEDDISSTADEIEKISKLENITIDGIFTHFADSDGSDETFTKKQFGVFIKLLDELKARGIDYGTRHCCNSAATVRFNEMHLDMVRAGIILYGICPSPEAYDSALLPAMKLSARVCAVHKLNKGDCVSYSCTYKAEKDMRVAVVSIGYADGFSRVYSGKPLIKINGRQVSTIGKICMDLCIVDIGDIECQVGDEAVIFEDSEGLDKLAEAMGTINYEILCSLRQRVLLEYV